MRSDRGPTKVDACETQLHYVPHRQLHTAAAAEQAFQVWKRIAHPTSYAGAPVEVDAFLALHTAAYRAARQNRCRTVAARDRRRWRDRHQRIRAYLVERNLGLAYALVRRCRCSASDHDDRVSAALGALLRAVDQFNPWKGYRFSTYACTAIVRALQAQERRTLRYRRQFPSCHDGTLEVSGRVDTRTELYVERVRRALDANLGDLNALEARILAERFPLSHEAPSTLGAIGESVGLCKERVRQIQNAALRKLRLVLNADPVLQ